MIQNTRSKTLLACASTALLLGATSASAVTTFTGATSGALVDPTNWSAGLPTRDNPGIIQDAAVTTGGGDLNLMDSTIVTVSGASVWTATGLRFDDNIITFEDSSSLQTTGAVALGRDLVDDTFSVMNWNSTGSFSNSGTPFLVGRKANGTMVQTAGIVEVGDVLIGGNLANETNDGIGLYTLAGGAVETSTLAFQAAGGALDFTVDSTGVVNISNAALGFADATADLQAAIDAGNITIGGQVQTAGDYSGFLITYTAGVGTSIQLSDGSGPVLWAGYEVDDQGNVDTMGWIGTLNVALPDWTYSYSLDNWLYLPESYVTPQGSWMYVTKP
ncbi:hypothetical protein G0Q06_03350 [Puniceicoccales bacterium CK1056]|uniref:Uncharacterized protein n=1 Tax=Oceanipulchritudo coccoides TaxID=2706888 RepID=A0A6B2M180_9BACT|nr:hypothetical protein [Oceanipulchritudo coccoides]NDV61480.1 hypothetical protein [Oceanipulchritudo coccoides]